MKLVEEGKLDLDLPIKEYIDWFCLSDCEARDKITLRHLLSHRSGLPAEYTPEGPKDEGMLKESLIEGLPALELLYRPDEGYKYSNWGFRLISAVIESRMGERYSTLATREVLSPLGMTSSAYILDRDGAYDIAMPHYRDEVGNLFVEPYIKENYCRLAAGGLYSSSLDLCRLARLLLSGGVTDRGERIISRESLELMKSSATLLPSGDSYGLALQCHRFGEISAFGHYGSAPPYSSAMYVDEKSGYGVAVLLNTKCEDLRRVITETVLAELSESSGI
jgi:CubicO group peptidase (beta-lactamase class C family)